ncbi:MFS general substrate transporter [Rhizodiscina lignyota]|uniref:MFS general substrate transporter n=1 Tax=Rhizodiscina lignyota TaxID=1504668 RepID=A0A9P4IIH2_9PEZI|nr:MFS general substrate transporter [Rhizodiscina lignyota]
MALGVLEDHVMQHVPGTINLAEKHQDEVQQRGLKHGTGSASHIVLAPQPSEDPNDPLNWPYSKKLVIVCILAYGACLLASTFGPLLSAGTAVVAIDLNTTIADVTKLSGYQLLVAGCSGPFVLAFSRKYGKRPVLLYSSIMGLIGTIVGSTSNSYNTLMAARIIQGFAIPANESLIFSVLADIFFVHQRGLFTSIMSFTLGAVSNLSSVICGPITNSLGWHYLFHIMNACLGFQLILLFLFVPETAYERDARYEIDEIADDNLQELAEKEAKDREKLRVLKATEQVEKLETKDSFIPPPPKKTFIQELAVWTGTHSDENLLQLVAGPIMCNVNIAACWMVVMTGAISSFYVSQSYVAAQVFAFPPYNLNAAGVGYLFLGPFLGGMIASIILGVISDPLILWCTNRNRGIYEPEFRLIPIILGVLGGVGLFGYAALIQNGDSMYAASALWGVTLCGFIGMQTPASTYVIDAYREMSSEMFIANMMFKNFLFYGYSYFVNNWAAASGPGQVFYVWGGVSFALLLTTIPLYVFGKRYRSYWHRHNLLKKLGVRTHAEF